MRTSKILSTADSLASEFERCCREYNTLRIAVAWCSDPQQIFPYKHIEDFTGRIESTVGISFNHTHPDAIEWFMGMRDADVRVFRRECGLFHPKLYLFTDGDGYACFAGSSNLTYGGFYTNREVNVLVEGPFSTEDASDICELLELLETWRSEELSFVPNAEWLNRYRKDYARDIAKERTCRIATPALYEEDHVGQANWLPKADWKTYYEQVMVGLERYGREAVDIHTVLDAAAQDLKLPWKRSYFKDKQARRIIGGWGDYGPLGFVAAAGSFGYLLKSSEQSWGTIVGAVNSIAKLSPPIKWTELESHLSKLVGLGNTMKVWGRVLCLVRPDLYCSVSSDSFRRELAKILLVPTTSFADTEGYIQLIKRLHSSPWFNSAKPQDQNESAIWARRVAFMDGIFWARKAA